MWWRKESLFFRFVHLRTHESATLVLFVSLRKVTSLSISLGFPPFLTLGIDSMMVMMMMIKSIINCCAFMTLQK